MPLSMMGVGAKLRIKAVGGNASVRRHLGDMGFVEGAEVTVPIEQVQKGDVFVVRPGENIPVDGSVKLDDKLTESLEPYDLKAAIPFQSAVLAGAMADHADADCDACEKRAVERVERSVEQTMLDTVRDYDTVNERNRRITTERGSATPALLPVWLMTTVKEGKTYTFAVNGQTGKLTCDVPADKKKSLLWGGGVFAGVFGVAALILALMDALGSGSLLIGAMVAIIIALAVVGALKGQLKQAAQQSAVRRRLF